MKTKLISLLTVCFIVFINLSVYKYERFVFAKSVTHKFATLINNAKEMNERPFYNVKDYGIYPNTGDNYRAIYNLIQETVYKTGGTLYFPEGKYTISCTIFIPDNTTLSGDGLKTEIYFNEKDTYFGTGLANAGSNVAIKNLKLSQKKQRYF